MGDVHACMKKIKHTTQYGIKVGCPGCTLIISDGQPELVCSPGSILCSKITRAAADAETKPKRKRHGRLI